MPTAQEMVNLYTDAEAKVLLGQSVQMNGRTLTRANLKEIRDGRREWERKVVRSSRRRGPSLARF